MTRIHISLFITLIIAATGSTALAGGATPCEFDGRQGAVFVKNDALYPIRVRIIHADTNQYHPDVKHYWEIEPGKGETIINNVGSDWGIRIGSSKIKCVGNAGTWDKATSTFIISTSSFHF